MARRREEKPVVFPVRVFTLQEEVQVKEAELQGHMNEETDVDQQVKVCRHRDDRDLTLFLRAGFQEARRLTVKDGDGVSVFDLAFSGHTDCCRVGSQSLLVTLGNLSVVLRFKTPCDLQEVCRLLWRTEDTEAHSKPQIKSRARPHTKSHADGEEIEHDEREKGGESGQIGPAVSSRRHPAMFDMRTEDSLATQYVQFHGCLSHQQNLLQDYQRTATYQKAFLDNEVDFRDKVVLSVGGGSGILPFFAVQAGAKRVYAVESSPMAEYAKILVQSNSLSDCIDILEGKIEEVSLPDMVDVIVSEPIGYMLLQEKKLESFLFARKWLRPNGVMLPSSGEIHLAPFTDEQLYIEHHARTSFWQQRSFHGVNLCGLHSAALDEVFKQPIVDTFDMHVLMASSAKHRIDFTEANEEDLNRMEIPFVFKLLQSGLVHGLAFWFDVAFSGSRSTVWFSTAPTEPLTHWYQVRCLLQTPLFAKLGQTLSGTVLLTTNKRQSYDIHITATVDQSGFRSGNVLDLKNPFFRMPSWLHG